MKVPSLRLWRYSFSVSPCPRALGHPVRLGLGLRGMPAIVHLGRYILLARFLSASFDGMGGETGPTVIAFFDSGLSTSETMGVSSENWPWLPLVVVGMPANDRGLGSVARPPSPDASPVIILNDH